jgi:hypothetical protein
MTVDYFQQFTSVNVTNNCGKILLPLPLTNPSILSRLTSPQSFFFWLKFMVKILVLGPSSILFPTHLFNTRLESVDRSHFHIVECIVVPNRQNSTVQ